MCHMGGKGSGCNDTRKLVSLPGDPISSKQFQRDFCFFLWIIVGIHCNTMDTTHSEAWASCNYLGVRITKSNIISYSIVFKSIVFLSTIRIS